MPFTRMVKGVAAFRNASPLYASRMMSDQLLFEEFAMEHCGRLREELAKAKRALEAMRKARSLSECENTWKDFLHLIERVWNKANAHFGRSSRWNGRRGEYEKLRREDPLLSYLVNARGADEHTVSEIATQLPGSIGIDPAEGTSLYIRKMIMWSGGMTICSPDKLRITFTPARLRLLPVTNRGRTYPVPASHMGAPIDPNNIIAMAEAALRFYDGLLSQTEAFFAK